MVPLDSPKPRDAPEAGYSAASAPAQPYPGSDGVVASAMKVFVTVATRFGEKSLFGVRMRTFLAKHPIPTMIRETCILILFATGLAGCGPIFGKRSISGRIIRSWNPSR
jgi:hypothetical protein